MQFINKLRTRRHFQTTTNGWVFWVMAILCWFCLFSEAECGLSPSIPKVEKRIQANVHSQGLVEKDTFVSDRKLEKSEIKVEPSNPTGVSKESSKIIEQQTPRPSRKKWKWNPRIMIWGYMGLVGLLTGLLTVLLLTKVLALFWVSIFFWVILALAVFMFVFYFAFSERFEESYKFLKTGNLFFKKILGNTQVRKSKNFLTEEKKKKKSTGKKYKSAESKKYKRYQRKHQRKNWAAKNRRLSRTKTYRGVRRKKRRRSPYRRPAR